MIWMCIIGYFLMGSFIYGLSTEIEPEDDHFEIVILWPLYIVCSVILPVPYHLGKYIGKKISGK